MNTYWGELFNAIHEKDLVSIEFHNMQEKTTNYWIRIKDLDPLNRTLFVKGIHLEMYTLKELKLFHYFDLNHVDNTHARRHYYIMDILIQFNKLHLFLETTFCFFEFKESPLNISF